MDGGQAFQKSFAAWGSALASATCLSVLALLKFAKYISTNQWRFGLLHTSTSMQWLAMQETLCVVHQQTAYTRLCITVHIQYLSSLQSVYITQ